MDVNASLIKSERQARSWTQQHLADVCNLSLRTVQRVERFGSAAPETVMELCSVLEVSRDALIVLQKVEAESQNWLSPAVAVVLIGFALFSGMAIGAILMLLAVQ